MSDAIESLLEEARAKIIICEPENARKIRELAGVSGPRMAKALGINNSTLHRWENGSTLPRADRLERWARLLSGLQQILDETFAPVAPTTLIEDAFNNRIGNSLRRSGMRTVEDVATRTESDLRCIRNFGAGSVDEVRRVLARAGLSLAASGEDLRNAHVRALLHGEEVPA